MGAALKFRHADIPRQAQELARLKVINGPDLGSVFVVTQPKFTVGRGEDNDIILADLKSSRRHAEFFWAGNQWNVKDLGSANGIVHNGRALRTTVIKSSDVIVVGETTIEFLTSEAGTSMLRALPRSIAEVSREQSVFADQQRKVRELAVPGGVKKAPAGKNAAGASAGNNSKALLLLAGVGVVVYVLYGSTEAPRFNKKVLPPPLSSYLPDTESTDVSVNKTADQFFHEGFREYRQKNYLRAKVQFETALQVDPGHRLAKLYLENCNNQIEDEVKYHIDNGKRNLDAGKLKEAKNDYEAIIRLKYREQTNPAYIEAQAQLREVEKELAAVRSP